MENSREVLTSAKLSLVVCLGFFVCTLNSTFTIKWVHRYNMLRTVLCTVAFCFLVMIPIVLTKFMKQLIQRRWAKNNMFTEEAEELNL